MPVDPATDWSCEIDAVYQTAAPGLENPDRAFTVDWLEGIVRANFTHSGRFGAVTMRRYAWSLDLDAGRYLKLLRTYSSHRGLDERTRERLFAGIRAVIDRAGGRIAKPQLTVLFLARLGR